MERLRVHVHFSYFIVLGSALLFANALLFMLCTVAMVLHELAHYYVARLRYYRCKSLNISAFGAVLYGDFDNAQGVDQIVIALAGPIANLLTCLACYALWWVFPVTYNYTDGLVSASLSMALINLLPAYPLDGGRVLTGIMHLHGKDNALSIAKDCTAVVAILLLVIFIISSFCGCGLYNVALFAVFLSASYLVEDECACYTRLTLDSNIMDRLGVGVEKKTLIFGSDVAWHSVIVRLKGHYVYEVQVMSNRHIIATINYNWLCNLLKKGDMNSTLGDIVKDKLYYV